ncbi:hypothetical protein WKW77_10030 [Variovorax ureilyticus]|uniref:Uncharacterized protein n=1 Tax=Variovorax ureilyticus TaxID=1836198 RepID=A0ABU8VCK8_9BURK
MSGRNWGAIAKADAAVWKWLFPLAVVFTVVLALYGDFTMLHWWAWIGGWALCGYLMQRFPKVPGVLIPALLFVLCVPFVVIAQVIALPANLYRFVKSRLFP